MSLSRAFTTRRNRKLSELSSTSSSSSASADLPHRALTTKHSFPGTIRHKISAPVELLSTTNMLSYNAPDIYPSSSSSNSTASSTSSASGDDVFDRSPSMPSTPLTSPDTSSIESSSPKPNHLSCYFGSPSISNSSEDAPMIPRRAPSHTKKLSESLARKRSTSQVSSRKGSVSSTARSSINMFSGNVEAMEHHNNQHHNNPFGLELAKVSELAEEYGLGKDQVAIVDPEEQDLVSRGLFKFCAEDYMSEIHDYLLESFNEGPYAPVSATSMWI